MKAEIVSIGTELLLGTITDTNAAYLAQRLAVLGIDCYYISQAGDNLVRLQEVLGRALERSDLVVTTGGLGPTQDDLTREAIAGCLGEEMKVDPSLESALRAWFGRRGVDMPERNLKQATLIPSASAIDNPIGTAPGWLVETEIGGSRRTLVAMPGVPFEMRRMWAEEVEPHLLGQSGTVLVSRTLKVLGYGESAVASMVADLMDGSNPTLAPYAKGDGIHLRVTAKANSDAEARQMVERLESSVRERLGTAVYGADEDTPAGVVAELLIACNCRIALLESGPDVLGALASLPAALQARGRPDLFVGDLDIPNLEAGETLLGANSGATVEGLARVLAEKLGASICAALVANVAPGEQAGSTEARVSVIIGSAGQDGHWTFESTEQYWKTARGEVSRLAGLALYNKLRLKLIDTESRAAHT